MMQYILSSNGFFLLIGSFLLAALGAILGKSKDRFANAWTSTFLIIGACIGIVLAVLALPVGQGFSFVFKTYFVPISVRIDGLSAFFVFTISLLVLASAIYGIGYVRQFYTHYSVGVLGFFLSIFIASLYLVVTANNGIYFLLVWELMALSSYFLVIYEHKEAENLRAGLLYFIMTHVGTAFLLLAFLLLYRTTGSFDFDIIRANAGSIPAVAKSLIFVFALLGLGTKAGIIPLHMWLPEAHPAAPSHVSALMSGVMIKTAIYMMIRLFLDVLSNFPAWWGIVVLLLGAISSLLGVLYALSSHDLKRLLAFHSVENIGIILLGLGSAMVFLSYGNTTLAVVGAAAALFHTINHAVFKGLLFLGAGSVVMQTGTRNMEEYGGLIKKMPYTAFFFLVGAVAISALPPLNGFASERLTFHALFSGVATDLFWMKAAFILSIASLAFTGGLAAACFVKAVGTTFLGRSRSHTEREIKESPLSLKIGMGILAVACVVLGVFAQQMTSILRDIVNSFSTISVSVFPPTPIAMPVGNGLELLIALLIMGLLVYALVQWVSRKQKITISRIWDCGEDPTKRMEITATSFSHSLVTIFKGVLKPSKQTGIEYSDAAIRYFTKSRSVVLGTTDVYKKYFYEPLGKGMLVLSMYTKKVQSGNMSLYLLYIFLTLLILLIWATR